MGYAYGVLTGEPGEEAVDGQADIPGAGRDFDTLVAQCLARIRVSVRKGERAPTDPKALARRVAWIVSSNRRRGRVPRDEAPNPQTGVPDSYIDQVLSFLREEEPFLRALREGEATAWAGVLETLSARAYHYLLQRGVEAGQARQLAQDFAQISAVTLWEQALERFPYDTTFDAWVSRVVAYEISQWGRSTKEQREQRALSLDAVPDPQVQGMLYELLPDLGASHALDMADARMMLEDALQKLSSEDQRQAVLRQLAGQSNEEIARALRRSRQAVYNLRHRALLKLRAALESQSRRK